MPVQVAALAGGVNVFFGCVYFPVRPGSALAEWQKRRTL